MIGCYFLGLNMILHMISNTYRQGRLRLEHALQSNTFQNLDNKIRLTGSMEEVLSRLTPAVLIEVGRPENGQ